MASKFNRVASMGSKNSKYGTQRDGTFAAGDQVIVARTQYGTVVKAGRGYVIVNIDGIETSYNPRYVEEA